MPGKCFLKITRQIRQLPLDNLLCLSYNVVVLYIVKLRIGDRVHSKDYLPLTETSFFILLSIAVTPKHGYAIIKDVESMSQRRVSLATGTLYTALRRMLEEDWIERVEDDSPASSSDRERKLYQLTDFGRRILGRETERLKSLVHLTDLRKATD